MKNIRNTKVDRGDKVIHILMWLSLTLFYCYQYVLRVLPNIIMPSVISKFGITAAEFGSFAGIYYIGYIAVHLPIGVLLTRFGEKKVIPLCVLLAASGLIPLIYFDFWGGVIIGRIITGIGSSAAAVGMFQAFRIIYPEKCARVLGFSVFFGLVTAVYAGRPLARFIELIGLNAVLSILLYLGIGLAILAYILMSKSIHRVSNSNVWDDIKAVICNYKLLLISLFAGLMVGPLEGFADAWGSALVVKVYGIEKVIADSLISFILLGMCVGCFIIPYIAEKTKLYLGTILASGLGMLVCFIYILSGRATEKSLYYTFLIIGLFCAYQVVVTAKVLTYVYLERSGMAAATSNMIVMAFGSIFHNAIGMRLDRLWDGAMIDGIRSYSSDAFVSSIAIIPFAISIAVVGFVVIIITDIINKRK